MQPCFCNQRGKLDKVYKYMVSINVPSLDFIKQRWEEELGFDIVDDIWDAAFDCIYSSSICARHSLIQFKVLHRLHYWKAASAGIYPDADPLCNRCKTVPATLYHMFWGCPELTISPCPLTAIFGVVPENISAVTHQHKALAFSSLLAQRLILLNWKNAAPPTHTHLIRSIMSNLKLEKIRYTLNGTLYN